MQHPVWREGIVAGVIGATVVAFLFLLADLLAGQPFHTPMVLGQGLVSVLGPGSDSGVVHVLAYTAFHYVAFIVVGVLASIIVNRAETQPSVLAGALILFIAFEVGFHALSSALALNERIGHSAMLVAIGNLLAAASMGVFLWRAHPALGDELRYALDGRADG